MFRRRIHGRTGTLRRLAPFAHVSAVSCLVLLACGSDAIALTITTPAMLMTGRGVVPTPAPFSPVYLRTSAMTMTGIGAVPASVPFTPVTVKTGSMMMTGRGNNP